MDVRRFWQRDAFWLALIVLFTVGLRTWQIATTEVPARDSIGYIRLAWQLQHEDWRTVIKKAPQHPGYPIAILGVSLPLREVLAGSLADRMQLSAQITSALASVLLIFPMVALGRELFDRRIALASAFLFQCLPASGRVMPDGLSEPLFLLLACSALWLVVRGMRTRSPWAFAGAGLSAGLAYWTRPEGGLIVVAAGLVLFVTQFIPAWRRSWKNWLACGASLGATAAAVALPFVLIVGHLTTKNSVKDVLDDPVRAERGVSGDKALFAVWWNKEDGEYPTDKRWAWYALGDALEQAFFHVAWVPGLVGLWYYRDRFWRVPGVWVLPLVGGGVAWALWNVAHRQGYLSDRHVLLILLGAVFWVVAGLGMMGRAVAALVDRVKPVSWGSQPAVCGTVLFALLCVAALSRTMLPLHTERAGFRQAGYWLAENTRPGDFIDDPYCWAEYYSGHVLTEGPEPPGPRTHYVVLERSENKHQRLKPKAEPEHIKLYGHELQKWRARRGSKDPAEVIVLRIEMPGRETN